MFIYKDAVGFVGNVGVWSDGERLVHVEIKCAPADLPYLNELLMESAW